MRTIVLRSAVLLVVAFSVTFVAPLTTAALSDGADALAVHGAFPPDTTITGGPSGLTNAHVSTFTFTSSDAVSTFECRVDAAAFAPCTSPFTTSSLANGAHTFEVSAIGAVGDTDPTPASRGFTVDTVAPQTTITGGPTGTTNDNTPTFTFTSPDAGSTFQCRIDAAAFAMCTTPFTTALAQGAHTFRVRATDAAGNSDQSPASRAFTVSTAPSPPGMPTCQGEKASIVGTAGDDHITGTGGNDVIVSLGGHDLINGRGGNDTICGGSGKDRLRGAGGKDRLRGDGGKDALLGGDQDDSLGGGSGRDNLDGGSGDDQLRGNGDDDELGGGSGNDRLDGGRGRDQCSGGSDRDVIVRCER